MAKREKKKDTIGSYALAIGIAFFIRWALLEAYVIPSGSMLPTLLIHDHIFANKFIYGIRFPFTKQWLVHFHKPQRGEVFIFRHPKEDIDLIKRIVGIPGDEVEYRDGELYLNGKKVEVRAPNEQEATRVSDAAENMSERAPLDSYIHAIELLPENVQHSTLLIKGANHLSLPLTKIPEGHYLAFGDNRDDSSDSRVWGFVPEENIIGRATFVWLSCENTLPVLTFICNPLEIRWKRFFHVVE